MVLCISKCKLKRFFGFFSFHLPPLRFHCVGGCWDRTQDCCNFDIDKPDALAKLWKSENVITLLINVPTYESAYCTYVMQGQSHYCILLVTK
jgi:hypothetical protein